jgi:siroheme synthase-like protein
LPEVSGLLTRAGVRVLGYPVVLNIAERPVVVVGGGVVARRKVEGLIRSGARVKVISPEVSPELSAVAEVSARHFEMSDIDDAALVFATTNDAALNAAIAAECRRRAIPVNVADQPELCDFHVAATVERGDVMVAISTGGASPALSATIKRIVERAMPSSIEKAARLLGIFRDAFDRDDTTQSARADFYRKIASEEFLHLLVEDAAAAARFVETAAETAGFEIPVDAARLLRG